MCYFSRLQFFEREERGSFIHPLMKDKILIRTSEFPCIYY
nr:MAG TPA: hypothetical protein [Caudoviricetes sp.]